MNRPLSALITDLMAAVAARAQAGLPIGLEMSGETSAVVLETLEIWRVGALALEHPEVVVLFRKRAS